MNNLVEKIDNHTASGAPSVSELIELQELARSLKVPRAKLEKMIAEAIVRNSEKETSSSTDSPETIDTPYERPNYDSARNSFDLEMNQRREAESIPERKEIEFNRPEIIFPKMEDPFAEKVEETEPIADLPLDAEAPIETISNLEMEPVSVPENESVDPIDEIEEGIKEINENTAALEQASKEKMEQVQELMEKKREEATAESQRALEEAKRSHAIEVEKQKAQFAESQKIAELERLERENAANEKLDPLETVLDNAETSEDNLIDLIETIQGSKGGSIEFDEAVDELENTVSNISSETEEFVQKESQSINSKEDFEVLDRKDEIDDWVANANKEERKRAEDIAKRSLKADPSENRSFERDDKEYGVPSKKENAKAAFTLGIVALIVSILFGFVGGIIGIFGIGKASEGLRKIKLNPKSYEPGALSKLKNARTLSVISIVISAFKILRVFYFGFYYF